MSTATVDTKFDEVLKEELLSDVSIYSVRDFFDEIPLYSRYKQIEFLKQRGDVDLLLIELALQYLDRVMSEVHMPVQRFAAITVTGAEADEFIVPRIFVCNGAVRSKLKKLHLTRPTASFGKRIASLVRKAAPDRSYSVMQDESTIPGDVRVFVGSKLPPEGILSLDSFVKGTKREEGRKPRQSKR